MVKPVKISKKASGVSSLYLLIPGEIREELDCKCGDWYVPEIRDDGIFFKRLYL